jgi:hypothetical protein
MPNKLNAYLDLAKLQGAHRMFIKGKDGRARDCLVIVLEDSRAKVSEKNIARVNFSLDIVPNKSGKDDFGNTHWVKESTTKIERESATPPDLPFLGNAREYEAGGQRSARPAGGAPVTSDDGALAEGLADDDIPF